MKKLHYFAAAAASALAASTAHADGLKPIQAQSPDLGEVSGIGYYTVADDGFHVVATLAHDDTNEKPLRIHAVLLPGQSMVFLDSGHDNGRVSFHRNQASRRRSPRTT